MQSDLIFDIGLHKARDAAWYLAKGFRVIGVEAAPELCQEARSHCADAVADGRLAIVPKALYHTSGDSVPFFVTPEKDDWGSLYRSAAEKGVYTGQAKEITVLTITLHDLMDEFGDPYYIKCDIEGGDAIFAEQLQNARHKPPFVSLELTRPLDLARLAAAGYARFQLVNQWGNPFRSAPNPAREGVYAPSAFSHHTSGLFGRELPTDKWITFGEAMHRFQSWKAIRDLDPDLCFGWLDVHARME
jgi:FkbM family methyltransferase